MSSIYSIPKTNLFTFDGQRPSRSVILAQRVYGQGEVCSSNVTLGVKVT